jgi:hypothetical protein
MRYQGWRWGQRANFDKLVFSPVLPRCLRSEFPAVFYLMMARGNRRETISHDDDDRRFFIATLSEGCAITGWRRMVERLDRRAVEEEIKTCGMPVMAEATVQPFASRLVLGQPGVRREATRAFGKTNKSRKESSRAYRSTPQATAHGEEQAKRWLEDGLAAAGLVAKDLPRTKGSARRKLANLRWLGRNPPWRRPAGV